ncbi:MAG: 16S rRNA (guanine(527)-N(7))-methyltransferase RsmG [Caldisericia bacterium]|nr:16S rRNA (guanine(527)-N(7))-methyltransferase RsmG [Caldisericia bacterium]
MIEETLQTFLETNTWNLSGEQKEKLLQFLLLVQNVNPHINLVSNESDEELIYSQLQDCMQLFHFSWIPNADKTWIDVGSGGGFPGIIAAILYPCLKIILVESIRKKYSFLLYASIEAKLNNVHIFHDRAENIVNTPGIARDCAVFTARGVGSIEYVAPFFDQSLSSEGKAILWKNPDEIASFLTQNPQWESKEHFVYQSLKSEKHILVLQRKIQSLQGSRNARKSKKFCTTRTRSSTH